MKKLYHYDNENGFSRCEIRYKNNIFLGTALCHEVDTDMKSEKTGLFIAESRANIKFLAYIRDNEIKPELKILAHLQDCLKSSKKYNPKSYEAKMVRSQIRCLENQLAIVKEELTEEQEYLKNYIKNKDAFYKKIREGRNK